MRHDVAHTTEYWHLANHGIIEQTEELICY